MNSTKKILKARRELEVEIEKQIHLFEEEQGVVVADIYGARISEHAPIHMNIGVDFPSGL